MTNERLKELTELLNEACNAYYNEDHEIMSNKEYDALYDELRAGEKELGIVLPGSPTQTAGFDVVDGLKKVEHEIPALSLDKTKDRHMLGNWLGDRKGILSWKMDGLTVVATYMEGKLVSAVTRGNGHIGEDVTHNARTFAGLPQMIPAKQKVIVRGEAVISYHDFEEINEMLPDDAKYMNPRNLASGSVRLLDARKAAGRKVHFVAFTFANAMELGITSVDLSFRMLQSWGFETVEAEVVDAGNAAEMVGKFEHRIEDNPFPTDGLALTYDDIAYGESLGVTGKYPRNAIAFKWMDETAATTLTEVHWSASRTGLLNPVAVFDTVTLESTRVSRASLHNVSYLQNLELGIGDHITVYKANMIIPQVDKNLTAGEHEPVEIPEKCPVCGGKTEIRIGADGMTRSLYCTNDGCPAKHQGDLERFVSRDAMNIVGLAGSTLETLVGYGFVRNCFDIFELNRYRDQIVTLDGFGVKSYDKLWEAINTSKKTTFRQFFYCLGIPGCGHNIAKILEKELRGTTKTAALKEILESPDPVMKLMGMDGIGSGKAMTMSEWYDKEENTRMYNDLLKILEITDDRIITKSAAGVLGGKTFVITGSLTHYKNRKALTLDIEDRGGKVSGSVSAKTDYLISNEPSTSAKSQKAAALGVPVITEDEYIDMFRKI